MKCSLDTKSQVVFEHQERGIEKVKNLKILQIFRKFFSKDQIQTSNKKVFSMAEFDKECLEFLKKKAVFS